MEVSSLLTFFFLCVFLMPRGFSPAWVAVATPNRLPNLCELSCFFAPHICFFPLPFLQTYVWWASGCPLCGRPGVGMVSAPRASKQGIFYKKKKIIIIWATIRQTTTYIWTVLSVERFKLMFS